MSIYVGASNAKKEAAQLYLGRDGTKSEVVEAYALKDGTVSEVYNSAPEPGQQVFTTSGEFTVPKGVRKVDVFLVGGGGCGSNSPWQSASILAYGAIYASYGYTASGGAGGYTTTQKGISVKAGDQYAIIVGDGARESAVGGTSSAFGNIAKGGNGYSDSNIHGGSGGGHGVYTCIDADNHYFTSAVAGGSDGSGTQMDRCKTSYWNGNNFYYDRLVNSFYGVGQNTTTRAFGEESGTLYAGGGGGSGYKELGWSEIRGAAGGSGGGGNGGIGSVNDGLNYHTYELFYGKNSLLPPTGGAAGTGGGGGGRGYSFTGTTSSDTGYGYPGYGGSGCVIVRWGY